MDRAEPVMATSITAPGFRRWPLPHRRLRSTDPTPRGHLPRPRRTPDEPERSAAPLETSRESQPRSAGLEAFSARAPVRPFLTLPVCVPGEILCVSRAEQLSEVATCRRLPAPAALPRSTLATLE